MLAAIFIHITKYCFVILNYIMCLISITRIQLMIWCTCNPRKFRKTGILSLSPTGGNVNLYASNAFIRILLLEGLSHYSCMHNMHNLTGNLIYENDFPCIYKRLTWIYYEVRLIYFAFYFRDAVYSFAIRVIYTAAHNSGRVSSQEEEM